MIRLEALNSLIVVRDLSTKVSAARTLIQIIQQIYEGVFIPTSMLSIFNALQSSTTEFRTKSLENCRFGFRLNQDPDSKKNLKIWMHFVLFI